MNRTTALTEIHAFLFADTTLAAAVSNRIYYARGPVTSAWPQLVYFDVTETNGYQVDYNSVTVQFSLWSTDTFQALSLIERVRVIFSRLSDIVSGSFNYVSLIDSGALPQEDQQLYGQFLRFQFRYRGENIEE